MSKIDKQHYVGIFEFDNAEHVGEITIDNNSGKIFLTMTIAIDAFGKNYNQIDCIKGHLAEGRLQVYLINCSRYNGHVYFASHQNICLTVEHVFWSSIPLCEYSFDWSEVELENALRWSGLSCINRSEMNDIHFNKHEKYEFNYLDFHITFVSRITQNLEIFPTQEENSITERLVMRIECKEKKPYKEFIKIRDQFISLISFCVKNNINVLKQKFRKSDSCFQMPNRHNIPYECRFDEGGNKSIIYDSIHETEMNFTLKQLDVDFFQNEANIKNLEKFKPIFNLYLSLFKYQDMPIEMIFLNIVQALETYHSRFKYKEKDAYKEHVWTLEKDCRFEKILRPLLWDSSQNDKNTPFIILHSRLNDLFIFTDNDLFRALYLNKDFAQAVSTTRHYLTHYDEQKETKSFKGKDLETAIYLLELVLEYHICSEFNIDKTAYITNELNNALIANNILL